MKKLSTAAMAATLVLAGCAGTRAPKLAKCAGPYRYANPYGSVLPSLPIPGQPSPAPDATSSPAQAPSAGAPAATAPAAPPAASPPAPSTDPSAHVPSPPVGDQAQPGKTSALMPHYPSC